MPPGIGNVDRSHFAAEGRHETRLIPGPTANIQHPQTRFEPGSDGINLEASDSFEVAAVHVHAALASAPGEGVESSRGIRLFTGWEDKPREVWGARKKRLCKLQKS